MGHARIYEINAKIEVSRKKLMTPNDSVDLQKIKSKLEEARAELARVKTLKTTLGPDLGSDTFQKLEQSQKKAQAMFEKRRTELIASLVEQYLEEQRAKLENKLPELNLQNWQKALEAFEVLKNIDLPFLAKVSSKIEEQVLEAVKKRLLARVFEDLPDVKAAELRQLLVQDDSALVSQFLKTNKPEFNLWAAEEVGRIKKELAGFIS